MDTPRGPCAPEAGNRSVKHINLPDAEDGYALPDHTGGSFSFEIRGSTE